MFHRTWLEIDISAFESNVAHMLADVHPAQLLAVLKADGYGLGAAPLARAALAAGAARIGVATADEAMALAGERMPLQVMSAVFPEELPALIGAGIDIPLHDVAMASEISSAASMVGRRARVHVKLDTGMGRLGLLPDDLERVVEINRDFHNIDIVGIFTHFPLSTEHCREACLAQIEEVKKALAFLAGRGFSIQVAHVANSDAIMHLPEAARPPFNMVRAGISMHGLTDMGDSRPEWLADVVSFHSRLVSVRRLPAGHAVGYGATFRLKRPTMIGTVAAGYADGVPLALSNRGAVVVNGHRCPVVGRISMDYTTIDLTNAPEAIAGAPVTLFGGHGGEVPTAADWAEAKGTHPYDIICSVAPRVVRVYRRK